MHSIRLFLLAFLTVPVTVAFVYGEAFSQVFPLHGREAVEAVEIRIVIIGDYIFHQTVFRLRDCSLRALPDQQDKIL